MLGLGDGGASSTTTTTFSVATAAPLLSTATPGAVVTGAGVGLLPLVATAGDADPRSLLMPVAALQGSNPAVNGVTSAAASSPAAAVVSQLGGINNNNNVNSSGVNSSSSNPGMEQVEEFVKPIMKDGEMILEVECGQNKAAMYLSKLCQGSKGPCISFQSSWLTPNEFQFVSGRETAKDWKRSIRHHGKSLKLLLAKGILSVHPTMCDCDGCRIGAVLTRKGEKRRIPNGERKRKSGGSAPENSGTGAFRAVGSGHGGVKTHDGPTDAKRMMPEKPLEGAQSPLKESSVMNLPDSKDATGSRPEVHMTDVSKLAVERLIHNPMIPLVSPNHCSDIKDSVTPAEISSSGPPKGRLSPAKVTDSANVPSSGVKAGGEEPSDVKVLSSSGGAPTGVASGDKSLSRLALYQAVKGEDGSEDKDEADCDSPAGDDKADCVGEPEDKAGEAVVSENEATKDGVVAAGDKVATVSSGVSVQVSGESPAEAAVKSRPVDDGHSTVSHSAKPSESASAAFNNNNTVAHRGLLSPSMPAAVAPAPALHSPSLPAPSSKPASSVPKDSSSSSKENRHKQSSSSSSVSSSSSSSRSKNSDRGEHLTIRHPSPDRRHSDSAAKQHSPVKSSKDHHSSSSDSKSRDRRHEGSSSSSSAADHHKDRHAHAKDSSSHSRDAEKRRPEDRSDKDRKSSSSSHGVKGEEGSYRGGEYPGVVRGAEGIPVSAAPMPMPTPVTDPAAFSEYIRYLASGHHGMVPPNGVLPHMFPMRPPGDVVGSGLLHPMHAAAACSVFSNPTALLAKDPALYPTTAATLPTPTYGYAGTPGVPPLHLMPPQYPAASTSLLDYSRSFPTAAYLPWSTPLPFMMPDAMAAAAAAAAANNSAAAKRSRDEMESAADLSSKRLQLPVSAYAGAVAPADYMAAYRNMAAPLACGMDPSLLEKNAEYMRKRMYPELPVPAAGGGGSGVKAMESAYVASLPEAYRALYYCRCMENRPGDIRTWGVDDVVKLLSTLEGCSVYTDTFREQRVDGKILVLLTTDHLIKNLNMKLGPAMTLTNRVAKALLESTQASGCERCRRLASIVPAVQSAIGGY